MQADLQEDRMAAVESHAVVDTESEAVEIRSVVTLVLPLLSLLPLAL